MIHPVRPVLVAGGPQLTRELLVHALTAAGVQPVVQGEADPAATVLLDPSHADWTLAHDTGRPVLVVTSRLLSGEEVVTLVQRGADALLPADSSPDALFQAVQSVTAGNAELDSRQARVLFDWVRTTGAAAFDDAPVLTAREFDILASLERGLSTKQTARSLGIAAKTVENIQRGLLRKLGARNRAQAVSRAHALGLVASSRTSRRSMPPPVTWEIPPVAGWGSFPLGGRVRRP